MAVKAAESIENVYTILFRLGEGAIQREGETPGQLSGDVALRPSPVPPTHASDRRQHRNGGRASDPSAAVPAGAETDRIPHIPGSMPVAAGPAASGAGGPSSHASVSRSGHPCRFHGALHAPLQALLQRVPGRFCRTACTCCTWLCSVAASFSTDRGYGVLPMDVPHFPNSSLVRLNRVYSSYCEKP